MDGCDITSYAGETTGTAQQGMRGFLWFFLCLFSVAPLVWADPAARVASAPGYDAVVTDVVLVQTGSSVRVSGHVRRGLPWAGTGWGCLDLSFFDQNKDLIRRIATDYFPRPIPRAFHSAYEPASRFLVVLNGVTRRVSAVVIEYRDQARSDAAFTPRHD